jgi:hypothetical protein
MKSLTSWSSGSGNCCILATVRSCTVMALSLQERALASMGVFLSGGLYTLSGRFSWGGHGIFEAERMRVVVSRGRHNNSVERNRGAAP